MAITPDFAAFDMVDVPVVVLDPQRKLKACNAAFLSRSGRSIQELLGSDLADALVASGASRLALDQAWDLAVLTERPLAALDIDASDADGLGWPLRLSGRRQALGWVLTLQARADEVLWRAEEQRLNGMLELARDLGRLGLWERDLRTGLGRWDLGMWQLWGLPPQVTAPQIDQAMRQVAEVDQPILRRALLNSASRLGRGDLPVRLVRPDGQERQLHAHWEVQAGADGKPLRMLGIMRDDTEVYRLALSANRSQAQLRLAAEMVDMAVWRRDLLRDEIHLSPKGREMLRLPPSEQILTLSEFAALVHPQDLAEARNHGLLQADATHLAAPDLTLRLRRGDGQWRYWLMRGALQCDEAEQPLGSVGVALDVTDRFEASQQALELGRRLEMATAAAGIGTWDYRPESNSWHWDAQMRLLHGLTPDEPQSHSHGYLSRFVQPGHHAAVREGVRRLRQQGHGMLDLDLSLTTPSGQHRRLSTRTTAETVNGRCRMMGVMLDVTERYAAEAKLREASERAILVARGAGIGTWESSPDAENGWWDAQMFALRGLAPQTLPVSRRAMLGWVHPEDQSAMRQLIEGAGHADHPYLAEFRVVWPDGSVHWLATRSTAVRDMAGQMVGRIGINWDVTEVHNAAAALQDKLLAEQDKLLAEQDKLLAEHDKLLAQRENQAKSRFLARMSHELRTPLNAVLGFSQLLLATTQRAADGAVLDPSQWRQRVEHVRAAGEHLLTLINDVLDLSSLESGELALHLGPVCLATLTQTTLPMLQTQADAAGVELLPGLITGHALADPVRLRQVLINLLSNAIKYNHAQGRVWIDARPVDGMLRLRVRDNGLGMTADQCSHLFEPFNRLGREREGVGGTGIGLAIVHALIQRMGGTIEVHSRLGQGSSFEIDLPLVAVPAQRQAASLAPADAGPEAMPDTGPPTASPPNKRLLYIEDNPVNQLIVAGLVALRPDLALDLADTGQDGLSQARTLRHALVLIDMQLPDIDGLEVLRQLRADPATAALHCVALSANAMPDDIQTALQAGFDDYWTKPLDMRAFLDALARFVGPPPGPV